MVYDIPAKRWLPKSAGLRKLDKILWVSTGPNEDIAYDPSGQDVNQVWYSPSLEQPARKLVQLPKQWLQNPPEMGPSGMVLPSNDYALYLDTPSGVTMAVAAPPAYGQIDGDADETRIVTRRLGDLTHVYITTVPNSLAGLPCSPGFADLAKPTS